MRVCTIPIFYSKNETTAANRILQIAKRPMKREAEAVEMIPTATADPIRYASAEISIVVRRNIDKLQK